jgi:class 3 adenylate cyclase/tetratricopeptide (TPR) repeat protein
VRCPSCGADNADHRKFCGECGAGLQAPCPTCGAPTDPGTRFCGECGAPLGQAAALPTPAPKVAERRLVSVLFADLVGFTALSESRDAEDVRDLLSRYFDTCRTLIDRYGGTVEKFIGDAVMAVWGAPTANEDDAERAVRAALDLVDAVGSLGQELGTSGLAARAGVLTGEAAVNLGAAGEGMVAGDLVNTASRLQSAADPGTVLVGESTVRAAGSAIAFGDERELTLKGKDEPVPAWRALRVVGQRKGVGRSARLEPPFVGREEELRLLKEMLHATARERRARLVSVTGIPGIGKSRLAWEFLKYVDGLADTVYWHQGRCPAYGEGITFWALGEMVRMRARIAETEPAAIARSKLSATVAEFVLDDDERRWIEPRLAHLLGLTEAPPGQRDELFSAWRTFFERIADQAPTVLLVEDLQWADPGLVDFVESILEWSRNHPILVVTLARPELIDRRPTWGAGQRSFSSVHLEPLDEIAMRRLLGGLVRDLPDPLAARVLGQAEGVPLYAVETVRMLADRGMLTERDGAYEVVGELVELDVPETLQALIASRLDALSATERSLLQDAAVLGKTFTAAALAAVTGDPPSEDVLRALVRKELLSLDTDPRSPERGQYGFVQALIREVAYGTLARRDRRSRHLAAAHYFESIGDEELAGVVSAHYADAYRESPEGPDRDAVGARARDWLSQAGERALSLGAPEQALGYLEQALQVTATGPERLDLLTAAGRAAGQANLHERAIDYLRQVVASHRDHGDATAVARVTALLAREFNELDQFAEVVELCRAALATVDKTDHAVVAPLAAELVAALALSGEHVTALEIGEMALAAAEQTDESDVLIQALGGRATALFSLGRHREAAVLARGAVALAAASGSLFAEAASTVLVSVIVPADDPREALTAALTGADLARRAGHRGGEILHLINAAEFAIWLGEWTQAATILADLTDRQLTPFQRGFRTACEAMLTGLTGDSAAGIATLDEMVGGSIEYVAARTTYLRARALLHLAAGDLPAALADARAAVAEDPAGINALEALVIEIRAALWSGDPASARAALTGMAGFHGRWLTACRLTAEAGLAAVEGRSDDAETGYRRAIDEWRLLDDPLHLALCALDQLLLLGRLPEDVLETARDIFTRIDAEPFLRRLTEASTATTVRA